MLKKIIGSVFLIILLADLTYSFIQYCNVELDGDMADVILPSEWCIKVFNDPLGFSSLINNDYYAAPNRFFALWPYSVFFKTVPFFLQNFVNPVESIYITCAIAKSLNQILIIIVISFYLINQINIFSFEFLTASMLIFPFFIVYNFWQLGIISDSITFTFSYSIPLGLTLLLFLPLFRKLFYHEKVLKSIPSKIFYILLSIYVSLNGPVIAPLLIIISFLTFVFLIVKNFNKESALKLSYKIKLSLKTIPKSVYFILITSIFFGLYSFYIGKNNIENTIVEKTLSERYHFLILGLQELPSHMPLLFPLLVIIIIYLILIRIFSYNEHGKKLIIFSFFVLIGSIIYIALLPLGGYRIYRPLIIRFDTVMPITLSVILIFGLISNFLIKNLKGKLKIIFISATVIFLFKYIYHDKPIIGHNNCERKALFELSKSTDSVVFLNYDCTIMSWQKILNSKDSDLNSELFKLWGITKNKKLYFQK